MRRLTIMEVNEHHGGKLPPDAVLRPDGEELSTPTAKPKHRTRSERFAVLNSFVDCTLADLTGAEAKVWLILFRDTKAATGTARTGQTDIARRAGLSVRAIKNAVRALETKGLLRVVHRGRLNVGPSVYRIHPTGSQGEA